MQLHVVQQYILLPGHLIWPYPNNEGQSTANSAAVLLWSRSRGTREFVLNAPEMRDTDVNGDTETSLTCIRLGGWDNSYWNTN